MSAQRTVARCHPRPGLARGVLFAALLTLAGCEAFDWRDGPPRGGLVASVEKAPIAPDGDVSGRATDLVLNLDVSMDPEVPGLALRVGDAVRVTLPGAFARTADLPLLDVFACMAQNLQCDTAVLLMGWPQGALGAPPPLDYTVHYEGIRTIVFTATADHLPSPPAAPGLKQVHLLLNGFTNPSPGRYGIGVTVETQDGTTHGTGWVHVLPRTRPSIAVTNLFHPGFVNGNYQEAAPGALAALPFDLLLWDRDGGPFEGVAIEDGRLRQGGAVVGHVSIKAPAGATGQEVFTEAASTRISAPITGVPAGHVPVRFRAGSAPGAYTITFALVGGNAVKQVVRVR